ncbi:MAG: hypothetical protein O7B99_05105, partial [Planctomycetota bacterium]|nr:hypothetical protein [Planctomycetota bacterium]
SVITPPIFEYPHAGSSACVIGGYVYRGCAVPDLQGTYFFADFSQGHLLSFRYDPVGGVTDFQDRSAELDPADVINDVVSFGEDGDGELLIVSFGGTIYRIVPAQTPATLVDCDGNEFDDACEISFDPVKDLNGDGVLDVCQDLSADTAAVSLSGGGTQVLSLHPGVGYANFPYVLLGSLSGTRPGYTAFGVTIPLNPDPYFFLTLQDPGQTPLVGSVGTLDDQGEATVFFLVPGNSNPGFVGLTVNHAFGVMDALGLIPIDASNAIPVEMLP